MIGALDIGGTHATAAAVDLTAQPPRVDTPHQRRYGPAATRQELLVGILEAVTAAHRPDIERWGVAAPGPFDYARGICLVTGLGKLEALYGVDLRTALSQELDVEQEAISFLNDADAFLLGEWVDGAATGASRAIGITLGTGVGSAFLVDGRIASEGPGVPPEGEMHRTQLRGLPFEDRVSPRAVLSTYGGDADDFATVASQAREGEPGARIVVESYATDLAEGLHPWVESFRPETLVFGGSISGTWDLIGPEVTNRLAEVCPNIHRSARPDYAPLIGAAHHAAT